MAAGHRGIFDDGDRGVVLALDHVAQRARLAPDRPGSASAPAPRPIKAATSGRTGERQGSGAAATKSRRVMITEILLRLRRVRELSAVALSVQAQMWQWRGRRSAKPALRHASFDRGARAAPAPAQVVVLDWPAASPAIAAGFADRCCGRAWASRRRNGACRMRDLADRLPAEKAVHPLQDHIRQVLDLDRRRPLDPQHQRAGLRRLAVRPAAAIGS